EPFEGRYTDLRTLSDAQLVDVQTRRSAWHARRARVILQHRAATGTLQAGTHERLRVMFRTLDNADWRLRAMWALHVTGGWSSDALVAALDDRDEYVRAWAVQLLAEGRQPSAAARARFAEMARDDESAVVRLYLASALQRLVPDERWPIAEALVTHAEDADDHNLPKMIWLGIEPLVAQDPALALERLSRGRL